MREVRDVKIEVHGLFLVQPRAELLFSFKDTDDAQSTSSRHRMSQTVKLRIIMESSEDSKGEAPGRQNRISNPWSAGKLGELPYTLTYMKRRSASIWFLLFWKCNENHR